MRLPKFLLKMIPGFQIIDIKEWLNKGFIEIYLDQQSNEQQPCCHRCQSPLKKITGSYRQRIQALFKLKILQVCGFLNSDYIPMSF